MVDKKRITRSTDLVGGSGKPTKGDDNNKKDEPVVTADAAVIQNQELAAAVEEAKSSGKKSVLTFESTQQSDAPINIYRERTEDGEFIWWTTEDGREVGRKAIEDINELTQVKVLKGYEFDIPFSVKVAEQLKAAGKAKTKFYRKDGAHRAGVSFEEFIKEKVEQ